MAQTASKASARKALALPRPFNRVLGRVLALPPEQALPLARSLWAEAESDHARLLAMRLRLRILRAALEAPKPAPVPPKPAVPIPAPAAQLPQLAPEPQPEPQPEIVPPAPEPEPQPEPQPEPPAKPAKAAKLTQMDLESGGLAAMMASLSGSFGDDDMG